MTAAAQFCPSGRQTEKDCICGLIQQIKHKIKTVIELSYHFEEMSKTLLIDCLYLVSTILQVNI